MALVGIGADETDTTKNVLAQRGQLPQGVATQQRLPSLVVVAVVDEVTRTMTTVMADVEGGVALRRFCQAPLEGPGIGVVVKKRTP